MVLADATSTRRSSVRAWLVLAEAMSAGLVVWLALTTVSPTFSNGATAHLRAAPFVPYATSVTVPSPPAAVGAPLQRSGLWLEIPALAIALPIRRGDGSDRIGYWAAWVYPGTADPGRPGNSYLYAHGVEGMFGSLPSARLGQVVMLHNYTLHTTQSMRVTRIVGRIRYDDISWIHAASSQPLLTLQTCITADPRDDRFVIQAS